MKTKIKIGACLLLAATTINTKGQDLQDIISIPATHYDAVRVKGNIVPGAPGAVLNRLGHMQSGPWGDGWSTWSALGTPIQSGMGVTPNGQNYYGLTVNRAGDRAFFGTKRIDTNRINTIIAWGDDDSLIFTPPPKSGGSNTDRLVFEFHNSNNSSAPVQNAMVLMPHGKNDGVYAGIGTYGPTEQLHTTKGVRFAGLTSGGSPTDLVGIDANGKLWRTSGIGNGALGNYCNAKQNPLTSNYEIPLRSSDFYFSDDQPFTTKVNVGYKCGSNTPAKFNVSTNFPTDPNNNMASTSIYAISTNPNQSNFECTGIYGNATSNPGTGGNINRGLSGFAEGEGLTCGVYGEATLGGGGHHSAGVWGSYGGYFKATSPLNNGNSYGIYATAANAAGLNYAGYFDGDITVMGIPFTSNTWWTTSDRKFKKDIKELSNVSDKLLKLTAYTYRFKTDEFEKMNFSKDEQIGVIAQELKELFPQLVTEKEGNNYVNYTGLIPVLIEGFKEQQKQLDDQKQLINQLLQKSSTTSGLDQNTMSANGFKMDQNEPNPFNGVTKISYSLPGSVTNAYLAVYDLSGKQIASFPISERGSSAINITSEKLAAGIYIYSIVADNKIIDSKRMIVAEK